MPVAALPIAVLAGVRLTLVVWPVILVLAAGSAQPLHLPRKRMGKHREAGIGVVLRSKVGSTERMAEGWQNHGNDGLRKNLFEYGDIKLVSKVASVRKSILAMLYGRDVANGKINLKKTVKELGLDDVELFLPIEQRATLEHLITARSGIYLRSGEYEDDLAGTMPKRGAHHPGTYFHYHNWDFNAAGTAFEKLTGLDIL